MGVIGVTVDGVTVDGVTVMRGDSGWGECGGVNVDGFRDIPAGVYLWGGAVRGARRHRLV